MSKATRLPEISKHFIYTTTSVYRGL